MKRKLRFLFLEPFFGGSHGDFAQGLTEHSRHDIERKLYHDRIYIHFVEQVQNRDVGRPG